MNERNLFGGLLSLKSEFHFGLFIGRLSTFRNLLNWPRFLGVPMDIEFDIPFVLYEVRPFPTPLERHAQLKSAIAFKWHFLDKLFPGLEFHIRADKWQIEETQDVFGTHNFFSDPVASLVTLDGLTRVLKEPASFRGVLKPSLSIISLDDLFDPKLGFKLVGSLELSGKNLGADIAYEVFNFQSTGYLTLGPLTFAANFLIKRAIIENPMKNWWVLKYQSDFDTLGGIKGPRAYDQDTIGIYDVLLDNKRGNVVLDKAGDEVFGYHPGNFTLQSTLEIRFPLVEKLFFGKLNGVVFGDIGFIGICDANFICFDRVGRLNKQNQDRQLGVSVGVGLRYVLPVGPISFDWGISPIHQSTGIFGRESRLHVQFGYPF